MRQSNGSIVELGHLLTTTAADGGKSGKGGKMAGNGGSWREIGEKCGGKRENAKRIGEMQEGLSL